MQTTDRTSLLPVTPRLVQRWNAAGAAAWMEGEAIAEDPVRRSRILAPGGGRPAWIHVDLPKRDAHGRRTPEATWDPLAALLHEAGALRVPKMNPATRATLRGLSDLGPRSTAQTVLALQLLRQDSPRLGELLGVRIVRISTIVIGDIVVSARHRDGIVVIRGPEAAHLEEICAALVQDDDPLDVRGLKARIDQVVPPVDVRELRTLVHDAVTAELADVVASLDALLVAGDGEAASAVEPLERAVQRGKERAPDGQAGDRCREALVELRRMRGDARTIVDPRPLRRLSIGASIIVVPILAVGTFGTNVLRPAWSSWSTWLASVGIVLIAVQLAAWRSPSPSSGGAGTGTSRPARGRWPKWLRGGLGLLFVLMAVLVALAA